MELIRHAESVSEKKESIVVVIVSYAFLGIMVLLYTIIASYHQEKQLNDIYSIEFESVDLKQLKQINQVQIEAPPQPKYEKFEFPVIIDSIIAVEKDSVIKEEIVQIIENNSNTDNVFNGNGTDPNGTDTVTTGNTLVEIVEEPDDQIFIYVPNMPEFIGGEKALRNWIATHTIYPPVAKENGIEGTVYLKFEVTKTGKIGDVVLTKGADPLLNDEAIRVIKGLPDFKPGELNGRKVNVWYSVPVTFRLN
jgi:periplasmic protein TonB